MTESPKQPISAPPEKVNLNELIPPEFVFLATGLIVDQINAAAAASSLQEQASSFADSIDAIIRTCMLPVTFAMNEVTNQHFQRFDIAGRIRLAKDNKEPSTEMLAEAAHAAWLRAHEYCENDGTDWIRSAGNGLRVKLHDPQVERASRELLKQTAVAIWSSFEVLFGDSAVHILNRDPDLSRPLFENQRTKKHFGEKASISIEVLAQHDFAISNKMGDLLLRTRRLDALGTIRDIYSVIANSGDLEAALNHQTLWILNQRRHLLVHRRGVADKEYLKKTGDRKKIGDHIVITSVEIEQYLKTVCDAALALFAAFPSK